MQIKPRILIAIHYLELGGAETSLIGLLHALDLQKVDVDLFVYSHQGELMEAIPSYVNLLPENKVWSMFEKPLKMVLLNGQFKMFCARMKAKSLMKEYVKRFHPLDRSAVFGYVGKEVSMILPDINPSVEYDLAISYLHPHNIVLDHVRAKKKICWIHTDYSTIDVNTEIELPVWGAYDNIVSISRDVTKAFLQRFPSLESKIIEMENILPKALIESKAEDGSGLSKEFVKRTGETVLLSVGRICAAKNYDNIPYIAQQLKNLGLLFHWFIVGPGNHTEIDALSEELGVSDSVTFFGSSSNPYPYIKACDIYVHPSRYEGKSIVVREAQILCKPVIITNYPTASSQIKDGIDGIICDLDNFKIAEAIYNLANDTDKQKRFIEYLCSHDYAGLDEVNKIYELLSV